MVLLTLDGKGERAVVVAIGKVHNLSVVEKNCEGMNLAALAVVNTDGKVEQDDSGMSRKGTRIGAIHANR